ncbi:MAG: hypothetical protein WBM50_26965 [Acidimicrobiales bacterium]
MGLRTGDEYQAGLKDDRQVWYDGERFMWLQTMEALALAPVEGAEKNPENGLFYCNESAIQAALRLYQRFCFGDTQRMKSINYEFHDKTEATAMVARILTPPHDRERLAWPEQYRPSAG